MSETKRVHDRALVKFCLEDASGKIKEEIAIELVLDEKKLWMQDVRSIISGLDGKVKQISMTYIHVMLNPLGERLETEETLFLDIDNLNQTPRHQR